MIKRIKTIEDFIERAISIHGNKYDYSLSTYVDHKFPIIIICKIHGEFKQTSNKHISLKRGCPICGGGYRSNTQDFIKKSIKIHNKKYDYSLVNYHNAYTHVKIICKIHGAFEQSPTHHLSGKGCPYCIYEQNKIGLEQFIERSNKIHNNKYDYSLSIYIRTDQKLIIICPNHGKFEQKPGSHLQGNGCPRCVHTTSKPEEEWLNSLNIVIRHTSIKINNRLFKVDGFDHITNTVYEFYGDFWHGNPKKYQPDKENVISRKTFGELYQKTLDKELALKIAGYNVISIWESDWKGM